ncbi:MAG: tetratricopeptide repeat protein [Alphaproteobacteria bacterium]|nr:tetratricopeptide repeat protein [Alphaproteobacteria bacterium]
MSTARPGPPASKTAAERLNAEGLRHLRAGDAGQARRAWRQAVALAPGSVAALGELATLHARGPALTAACLGYRRALAVAPRLAGLHLMLGTALVKAGEDAAGERALATALTLAPAEPMAHLNLATYLLQRRRMAVAERHFRRTIGTNPALEPALIGLGWVSSHRSRSRETRSLAHRAIALGPSSPEALALLGQAEMMTGNLAQATRTFRRATAVAVTPVTLKGLILGLHYDPAATSGELFELHRRWAALQAAPDRRARANRPDPERRLKVGYLSADLHGGHPVARNLVGLIEHHDPERIEVHVYASGDGTGDPVTERIRAATRIWRSTTGLDGRSLAALIRGDGIDVLVAVAGHTPLNRIAVAALKPAPVAVSLYDYTTSGLDQMDGFLSDGVLSPEGGEERFTETVIRLPCLYLHMPIEEVPVGPASAGPFTFGSCANPIKLNDRVIGLWARALAAVPDSRLVLKYRDAFADPDLVDDIGRRFAAAGIAVSRLAFEGHRTDRERHLAAVGGFDVALDTFPFNGCTTTYEALWMGVPVVTLAGRRFLGRMSAAFLHQVGLDDLAAATEEDFVSAAAGLARDAGRRARLLDAPAHAAAVEDAYRRLWKAWCRPSEPAPAEGGKESSLTF